MFDRETVLHSFRKYAKVRLTRLELPLIAFEFIFSLIRCRVQECLRKSYRLCKSKELLFARFLGS